VTDKEFNYETDESTVSHAAGEHGVFFVQDVHKIMSQFRDAEAKVSLDNAQFRSATLGVSRSHLEMTQVRKAEGYCFAYDGKITFDPEARIDEEAFFGTLDEEMSEGFGLAPFYFPNSKLITSHALSELAVVAFSDEGSVTYSNHHSYTTDAGRVRIAIEPPTHIEAKELEHGVAGQMYDHVRAYMFTLNALSMAIAQRRVNTVFVMTPEGPYYPNTQQRKDTEEKFLKQEPQKSIEAAVVEVPAEKPKMLLEDIGGLEKVCDELKKVAHSFNHAEIMKKWGAARPQGIFLYGPPGTGKTTLAQAFANEIDAELLEVKGSDIHGKFVGESEKNLMKIFADLKAKTEPTVLLLDEFEGLVNADNGNGSRVDVSVVGIFKREMNTLREQNENIIVIAASNHKDLIDPSLIRAGRFDLQCYVGLPNESARTQIFTNKIAAAIETLQRDDFDVFADGIDMFELGRLTDDMSGADIIEILRKMSFRKAMEEARYGSTTPITHADLVAMIKEHKTQ